MPFCCSPRSILAPVMAEAVIEPVTRLLKRSPDLRNAALVLAAAYGSLDRFDDAAVVLEEQAKLAPKDPQPLIALGLTYRQAKRNDEARQAFEKAAQLSPNNLLLIDQLVDLDLLDKHFDAARQRIRRQFQKTPNSPASHFFEGKSWPLKENGMRPRQSFKRRSSSIPIFPPPTICWSRLTLQPTNFRRQLANCRAALEEPQQYPGTYDAGARI